MKLLLPHIGRWRKLRIVVDRAVSLPCPGLDLCGNAATLTRLQPESKLDQPARRNTIDPLAENFQTPALNELITSGHIFRDAYLLSPKSLASITTLTISHYMVDSKPFFIHHLMHCLYRLQNLTNLELMYLDLDCSSEGRGLDDDQQLDIERMHFQGMHVSSLSSFYRAANYPRFIYLTFVWCELTEPIHMGGCTKLNLCNLSPDSGIRILLEDWDGDNTLFVIQCSNFNGHVLQQLSEEVSIGEWLCPRMTSLVVAYSTSFTSENLQRMVQAHREEHAKSGFADWDDLDDTIPSIESLLAFRCSDLASKDKAWFDNNVQYVSWDEWWGGMNIGAFMAGNADDFESQ
ncbi:predicted protein [Sparassis crispa]|uniref:F-box domain-containing protein n=1 Tax=Sparassis crispa TaxID=139825 RepID=A0A401H0L1_9APHY|nr:predicted protein [Sparassis crispa]GBE87954.1 predicted protein [Sparassis crispa]